MAENQNFADYPLSITEARAKSCRDITPRDALIGILRQIDAGELDIRRLVAVYIDTDEALSYSVSAEGTFQAVGLLAAGQHAILEDTRE